MSTQPSTSAGRLHHILSQLQKRNAKEPSLDAWSSVFGIPSTQFVDLVPLIYKVSQLVDEVSADMHKHVAGNPSLYLSWVTRVKAPFERYTNFGVQASHFLQSIDSEVMALIAICDDQLSQVVSEDVIVDEVRTDALRAVREARDAVQSDESLDRGARDYALRHLDMAEQALVEYQIFGIKRAVEGAETIIGMAAVASKGGRVADESESGSKVVDALKLTVLCITTAQSAQWLLETGKDFVKWLN